MQITPKLLRLSWEGYPLHHIKNEGWGFLVPFRHKRGESYEPEDELQIPLEELVDTCPVKGHECDDDYGREKTFDNINKKVEADMGKRTYYAMKKLNEKAKENKYNGLGVWSGIELQDCCHFFRLPHKDGPKYKVGNPLARDFLDMFSQNVLSAQGNEAEKTIPVRRQDTSVIKKEFGSDYASRELSLDLHPLKIKLGEFDVSFEGGQWIPASGKAGAVHKENIQLKKDIQQLEEENNMLRLKFEILLDMLTDKTIEDQSDLPRAHSTGSLKSRKK